MGLNYSNIMQANPDYTANQAIFVYHLRQNPHGHEQIYHELDNNHGGMCALGLGMEAFGILRSWEQYKEKFPDSEFHQFGSSEYYDPYAIIAEVLEIPKDHVVEIYALNDSDMYTFGEIADIFETYLRSDRSVGPRTLNKEAQYADRKKEFTKVWDNAFADYRVALVARDKLADELYAAEEVLDNLESDVVSALTEADVDTNWYDLADLSKLSAEEAWTQFFD